MSWLMHTAKAETVTNEGLTHTTPVPFSLKFKKAYSLMLLNWKKIKTAWYIRFCFPCY